MLKGQVARLLIEQGRAQAPLGSSLSKFPCISQDNIHQKKKKHEIVYLHFISFFFNVDHLFKVFIKFVTILLLFFCFVFFFGPNACGIFTP